MGVSVGAGFGGAFAEGLGQSLAANRKAKADREDRQSAHHMAAVNWMLNSGQVKDIADMEPMLALAMPDVFGEEAAKKSKKGGANGGIDGPSVIKHVLSQAIQGQAGTPLMPGPSAVQPPAPGRGADFTGPVPTQGEGADPLTSRPLATGSPSPGAPTRRTLGGVPLLSPEEVDQLGIDRKVHGDEAMISGKVALTRKILPALQALDPSATLDDAMMATGLKTRASVAGSIQKPPQVGTFGDQLLRKQAELGRPLTTTEVEDLRSEYSVQRFGQERESSAARLFGKSYGQLTPEERQKADDSARESIGETAAARTKGAGEGKMDAPLTIPQAQQTGGVVGQTSREASGQHVATKEQNELRRTSTQLTDQLTNVETLLSVLPSDKDMIGGKIPGAMLEIRRRSPETRAQVAALEAAVDSMVNNIARVVSGAKGAQSEPDAKRAEAAILQLKQNLTGALTGEGDTQESAKARIAETRKAIESLVGSLPPELAKKVEGAAAAPAAASTGGYTTKDGKLYLNGKPVE